MKVYQLKHLNDDFGGYNNNYFILFLIFQRMKTKTFHRVLINFNIEKVDIESHQCFILFRNLRVYIYIYIYDENMHIF